MPCNCGKASARRALAVSTNADGTAATVAAAAETRPPGMPRYRVIPDGDGTTAEFETWAAARRHQLAHGGKLRAI